MRALPLVALAACIPKVPTVRTADPVVVALPPGVWLSGVVPFAYAEKATVRVEAVRLDLAFHSAMGAGKNVGATDLIAAEWSVRFEPASPEQCAEVPTCTDAGPWNGTYRTYRAIPIWTVTGLAVKRTETEPKPAVEPVTP